MKGCIFVADGRTGAFNRLFVVLYDPILCSFCKAICMGIDFGIGGIASKLCRALAACVKETYYMFCLSM
jgi:hypothetical protein